MAVYSAASTADSTPATRAASSPSFSCTLGILSTPFTWVTRRATPAMNRSLVANRIWACQLPSACAPVSKNCLRTPASASGSS
ncbi:Uncharacterised protein [Mycobacteroides abscessus subsp. abscessus]|nr:Uncharacterised protein [Mycobacteroides abscessus subsp. abscessus]